MSTTHPRAWQTRDTLAAVALFLATAAFTLWQNSRIAVLWDISYSLDTAYRITLHQTLYKDLPFSHAPLSFLVQAAIIKIFGRVYYPHVLYATLAGATATILTWRILLRTLEDRLDNAWTTATLLAAPLAVLSVYSIYPHPIYDSDCILSILFALFLLQRADSEKTIPIRNFIAGAACTPSLFFKQNIGLPFLAIIVAAVITIAIIRRMQRTSIQPQLCILAGASAALAAELLIVHLTAGLHNYIYWTITFASQRRLPGFSLILGIYHQTSLLWTIPAAITALILLHRKQRRTKIAATALLAAPFLWTIASLAFVESSDPSDRAEQLLSLWPHLLILGIALALYTLRPSNLRTYPTLNTFFPLILLAIIHGTFLSQQLWGSTYALWPLLALLIAFLLLQIPTIAKPLAAIIAITFLLCGGLYATSRERLSYVHLDGSLTHATLPQLKGLVTPGPYIPDFEELIRATNAEIPVNEGIVLIPGQDPFYFTTGRIPQFPILLFDPTTNPYTPQQTLEQARTHNIQWLIINRNLQLMSDPSPNLPDYVAALQQDFAPVRTLTKYTIYHRK
jgi:hypothetical protein